MLVDASIKHASNCMGVKRKENTTPLGDSIKSSLKCIQATLWHEGSQTGLIVLKKQELDFILQRRLKACVGMVHARACKRCTGTRGLMQTK